MNHALLGAAIPFVLAAVLYGVSQPKGELVLRVRLADKAAPQLPSLVSIWPGADLQERVTAIAREAKFPFLGPNCLGLYVPFRVDTFFLPIERMIKPSPGNVAFVSQSGGILVDQMIKFTNEGVGLAKAISIGNKALLGELDLLDYFAADPATRDVPSIVFTKGGGGWLDEIAACGAAGVGLDWTVDLAQARARVGARVALQGNLDPLVLLTDPETVAREAIAVVEAAGPAPGHIFNLGHGIVPRTPPDNVAALKPYGFYGVDVSSGVEASHGKKDPTKVRLFVAQAKS